MTPVVAGGPAKQVEQVEQVVFGFTRTTGGREMGVSASSFPSGSGGPGMWHERLKEHFRLGADRTGKVGYAPSRALSYLEFDDGTGAVLRRCASGDLGRNVSHALVGRAADLGPLALYLDDWPGWRDAPPEGPLEPVALDDLNALVRRTAASLDREAVAHAAHAVLVVRAVLDRPGRGVTVVNVASVPPLPLLRLVRGVLDPLLNGPTPAVRWTFSTFELTDERGRRDLPTVVFLPSAPFAGETAHTRVYLDERPPADERTHFAQALVDDHVRDVGRAEPGASAAALVTPADAGADMPERIARARARRLGQSTDPAPPSRPPAPPSRRTPPPSPPPTVGAGQVTRPVTVGRAGTVPAEPGPSTVVTTFVGAPVVEPGVPPGRSEPGAPGNAAAASGDRTDGSTGRGESQERTPPSSWATGVALRHLDDAKLLDRAAAATDETALTAAFDEMRDRIGRTRAADRVALRERLWTLDFLVPVLERAGGPSVERARAFRTLLEFAYGPQARDLASPTAAAPLVGLLARPDTEPSCVSVAHAFAVRNGAGPAVDAALGRRWRTEHPPPASLDLDLPAAGRPEVLRAVAAWLRINRTTLLLVLLLAVLLLVVGVLLGSAL